MPWHEYLFVIAVLAAVPLLLIAFPLYLLLGGLQTFGRRLLERCFAGIEVRDKPKPGDVSFVYHTYRGLLLWVTMDEHHIVAPAADGERLLGRLLRFNLTWGLLSYGVAFIPFLTYGNYLVQRQEIRRQAFEILDQ